MRKSASSTTVRQQALPRSLPPRGLSREEAAAYFRISPTKFDQMRADGRVSAPKRIDGRLIWDLRRLDADFDNLPDLDSATADDNFD
jgi:hypothetical protein